MQQILINKINNKLVKTSRKTGKKIKNRKNLKKPRKKLKLIKHRLEIVVVCFITYILPSIVTRFKLYRNMWKYILQSPQLVSWTYGLLSCKGCCTYMYTQSTRESILCCRLRRKKCHTFEQKTKIRNVRHLKNKK